jgi:hypothetical protein
MTETSSDLDGGAMKSDGGSAFPSEQSECQDNTWNQTFDPGMSLRDWFAGQALVGLMSGSCMRPSALDEFEYMAKQLYQVADAMLKERAKGAAA